MTRSVVPWSWSMLESYQTCPRQFYELKLAKNFEEKENDDLRWGNEVHKALEKRVGDGVPLPHNMIKFENIALQVSKAPGLIMCEQKMAVDTQLDACDFFGANVWNRGVDDVLIINGHKALTIDWKTGKQKKYSRQLELSALRVFAKYKEVDVVHTAYAWLATGTWTRAKFTREQEGQLWEGFFSDIQQMIWSEENNTWPAKPSGLCKKSRKPGSSYMGCPVATCPHSEYYRKP